MKLNILIGIPILFLASSISYALDIPRARCEDDAIPHPNTAEVEGRLRFAAKCDAAYIAKKTLGNPTTANIENWISYTLYNNGKKEDGYRSIIEFPVFGYAATRQVFVAPKSGDAPCNLPPSVVIIAECEDGCVAKGTRLLTNRGWTPAGAFDVTLDTSVRGLGQSSTLDNPRYLDVPVDRFLEDIAPTWQNLLRLTADGRNMSVTTNHPLLRADGVLVEAKDLKVGDALLNANMSPAKVTAIEPFKEWGKVYNVMPGGKAVAETFVLFEGFLSGTVYHQNEGRQLINRQILRSTIPENLLR